MDRENSNLKMMDKMGRIVKYQHKFETIFKKKFTY